MAQSPQNPNAPQTRNNAAPGTDFFSPYPVGVVNEDTYNPYYRVELKGNVIPMRKIKANTIAGLEAIFDRVETIFDEEARSTIKSSMPLSSFKTGADASTPYDGVSITSDGKVTIVLPKRQAPNANANGANANGANAKANGANAKANGANGANVNTNTNTNANVKKRTVVLEINAAFPDESTIAMVSEVALMYQQYVTMCICEALSTLVTRYLDGKSADEIGPSVGEEMTSKLANMYGTAERYLAIKP
jgi:hypothetical protein